MPKKLTDASSKNDSYIAQNIITKLFYKIFSGATNNNTSKTDKKEFEDELPILPDFSADIEMNKMSVNKEQSIHDGLHDSQNITNNKINENKEQSSNNDLQDLGNILIKSATDMKNVKISKDKKLFTDDDLHNPVKVLIKSATDMKNEKISKDKKQFTDDDLNDPGKVLMKSATDMKNDKISKNKEQSVQDGLHETTLIDGLHGNTTPDMKKKLNENKRQAIVDRFLNSGNGDQSALCKEQNSDISEVEFDSHISPDTRKLECFESNQTLISKEENNIKNKILAWEKLSKTGISKYSEMSEFSAFGESHSNPEIENNCMKMNKSNVEKTIQQNSSITVDPESFIPDASEETKIRAGFAVTRVSPKIANLQATILQKLKED
ncbi:uncharacterized protein LOC119689794 [Teleopsis dalmanni]|uniref:uncharacterized protein LOC119689794 n=1 Tax=Teleopsis dalmanni TaxID=139649 RepID=UPI0018CFAF1D|nr:uncharacterized protein LOC119689794 [Teleopsis dalmanni]XP_037960627.1 uncharacterized protein LOC119689794 [Teleopsis dalmanni]